MKITASRRANRRVSLADVARRARVSLMTASYAMRNNPKISERTRDRVRSWARRLGYVPNPEIGRLMHLLRARGKPAYQATLGFLFFSASTHAAAHRYTLDLMAGAKARAHALGYGVDVLNINSGQLSSARLTGMLKSRGIRGVLIPPLPVIADCSHLLDWSQFSVIAATYSAQNLLVNRVVPHHQNNIFLAISRLIAIGCRRLGLVLTGDLLLRANHAYQATFALYQRSGEIADIPALNVDAAQPVDARVIDPWLRKYRPEIIVTVENAVSGFRALFAKGPRPSPSFCLLDHSGVGTLPGIDQYSGIIGETAVDLLAAQMQRGEIGFERHARVTMVEGGWRAGGKKS